MCWYCEISLNRVRLSISQNYGSIYLRLRSVWYCGAFWWWLQKVIHIFVRNSHFLLSTFRRLQKHLQVFSCICIRFATVIGLDGKIVCRIRRKLCTNCWQFCYNLSRITQTNPEFKFILRFAWFYIFEIVGPVLVAKIKASS